MSTVRPGSTKVADIDDILARIRGAAAPKPHNARTIAALTANPGCTRRAVMDAAGIDKQLVAARAGFPAQTGQSQFAITRGNAFEAQVKADGCAELVRLLRETLDLPVPDATYADLEAIGGSDSLADRYARTRRLIGSAVADTGILLDHPLLRVDVGGRAAYLEPDLVAVQVAGRFHVVEIKSFPVIDGQADGAKVSAAVTQAAVYVLALRELLADLGHGPERVADEIVLVCPENFSNRPTAVLVDVRKQLTVLRRQLARMTRIDELVATLPPDLSFATPERSTSSLRVIAPRYAPECLDACELAYFCRDEARDSTASLGRSVRDDLGGIDSIATALDLATGGTPTDDQVEAAEALRAAHRLRRESLAGPA
jgi:hypothetical protein